MAELIPDGAPTKKSVPQYQALPAAVRPRDPVGRTMRLLAAEQLAALVRLDARLKGDLRPYVCEPRRERVDIEIAQTVEESSPRL